MATSMDKDMPFPSQRRLTIPELLASRHLIGASRSTTNLSSAIAWNSCRMQNMIVAVGPGTPASAATAQDQESSSSSSSSSEEEQDEVMDDDDVESDEDMHDTIAENGDGMNEGSRIRQRLGSGSSTVELQASDLAERIVLEWLEEQDEQEDEEEESEQEETPSGNFVSSIRHGGCINTATWLTSKWRLSLPGSFATCVDSDECPTQLLTSGDDRTVKFWDVRHAMGTSSPVPGGRYMQCPFADISECKPYDWKSHVTMGTPLFGSVIPLATLATGHRANVFHVTPLDFHPGKVLTCGADGYLRMADVHSSSDASFIVVSPEYGHDDNDDLLPAGLASLRTGMCFSHHMLNANTGLLCGERGLRRFDLRLSPREQATRSLLGSDKMCKSCVIWSASSTSSDDMDSAYVFAGGPSADVALYDLRMTDGSSSRIVQKYRPKGLAADAQVSVSGLDVSKDKRELLVSYENDQIFTFPVFPNTSAAGPTIDELTDFCSAYDGNKGDDIVLHELAAYGGHLNRFTFLKNAKYAGPQDEYICTGSDSGRAWIYERATGTVASFLSADQSTCNGVVPHPMLPFFITYGIDSTAKLWRATSPVDRDADDSPLGRARRHHRHQYEKSPIIRSWTYVKATAASITNLEEEEAEIVTMYPDQFPITDDTTGNSLLGSILLQRRLFGLPGSQTSSIGNDLIELPNILRQNVFTCILAADEGESEPMWSGLHDLFRRVSTIRLRHQADQRGLLWNADTPWILRSRKWYEGKPLTEKSKKADASTMLESTMYGNPFDLVPASPSDWIPYDDEMTKSPRPCGPRFNTEEYENFYWERYSQFRPAKAASKTVDSTWIRTKPANEDGKPRSLTNEGDASEESTSAVPYDSDHAWNMLHDTALLLKEGGNEALEAGSVMEAARRYDCAINYCAVAFLLHPNANEEFISRGDRKWCPLRKIMVTCRLNLCMVLSNFDIRGARDQALMALKELAPFCTEEGKVLGGKKLSVVHNPIEPIETFQETKELQAKAYFRLASVNFVAGDFEEAVEKFEESIKCTKALSKEPDRVIIRRLGEAKREKTRKNKRQRKKFKRMLAQEASRDDNS